MGGDAFGRLYEAMRRAGSGGAGGLRVRLGTVLAASPLKIDVAGTTQEAERFYIADRLRKGHGETVALRGGSGGFSANGHTHAVTLDAGTLQIGGAELVLDSPVLRAGDLVLLLTEDDQTFYLLDKVVREA